MVRVPPVNLQQNVSYTDVGKKMERGTILQVQESAAKLRYEVYKCRLIYWLHKGIPHQPAQIEESYNTQPVFLSTAMKVEPLRDDERFWFQMLVRRVVKSSYPFELGSAGVHKLGRRLTYGSGHGSFAC